MNTQSLEGGFTNPACDSARAFRAVLEAMSRPGQIQTLVGGEAPVPMGVAAATVALTLCDHATGFWLGPSVDNEAVVSWFAFHTGAPSAARQDATFAFGTWEEMLPLGDFAVGTSEYPDRSATLVVEVPALGEANRLTGPGIRTDAFVSVPDPAAFRDNRALFPQGWDLILTCGDQIVGLPRTVIVEN